MMWCSHIKRTSGLWHHKCGQIHSSSVRRGSRFVIILLQGSTMLNVDTCSAKTAQLSSRPSQISSDSLPSIQLRLPQTQRVKMKSSHIKASHPDNTQTRRSQPLSSSITDALKPHKFAQVCLPNTTCQRGSNRKKQPRSSDPAPIHGLVRRGTKSCLKLRISSEGPPFMILSYYLCYLNLITMKTNDNKKKAVAISVVNECFWGACLSTPGQL